MDTILQEIIDTLRTEPELIDDAWLTRLIHRSNAGKSDPSTHIGKRKLGPFLLAQRDADTELWRSWNLSEDEQRELLRIVRMKPRRTASGVATVSVITKPHPCSSDCVYCPCDIRMPKSYLANEPACQRAEQNFFDPYLQVRIRLRVLEAMGHTTDKVELIVLGGTWNDYPEDYRLWFVSELFRALNDAGASAVSAPPYTVPMGSDEEGRIAFYRGLGLSDSAEKIAQDTSDLQREVSEGHCSYNEAIRRMYGGGAWAKAAEFQSATREDLLAQQLTNEDAACRAVGLSIETRPDLVDPASAREMRRMGCTKVQIGIQSLDRRILELNGRDITPERIEEAFRYLRLFGFKIQVHMMANLLGATPAGDREDYRMLVCDPRFLPDEVKLYPCALVESSRLGAHYEDGSWVPYTREELIELLSDNIQITPAYTRVSRMIRDISSDDILAGNKVTNLRQMVDGTRAERGLSSREIRGREVATSDVELGELSLEDYGYTTTVSEEHFLQWTDANDRIAGFLRLSLPHRDALEGLGDAHPTGGDEAMIREVHIYGRVAGLGDAEDGAAQHAGLGTALIERACELAASHGYRAINVISAVGTRGYYRTKGFEDSGLYQRRGLNT